MEHFTPMASLFGGMLIGLAAAMLLLSSGRICGISGIFGGLLRAPRNDTVWRIWFIGGLLVGGMALRIFYPQAFDIQIGYSAPAILLGGLLVGIGTRMGSGCTSGHGICGIGRLSMRSMVACAVFMLFGVLAAVAVHSLFGGTL